LPPQGRLTGEVGRKPDSLAPLRALGAIIPLPHVYASPLDRKMYGFKWFSGPCTTGDEHPPGFLNTLLIYDPVGAGGCTASSCMVIFSINT